MKKLFLFIGGLCLCMHTLRAQITIMNEDVQEKIVSKPVAFDSLSNIAYQKDPIQYKKYIGYKLYCLPLSNKFKGDKSKYDVNNGFTYFQSKSPRVFVKEHLPFDQTAEAKIFGDVKKLKGNSLASYNRMKENYEKGYITNTQIYKATEVKRGNIYTPYDSIQNTYFTILNIEIAASTEAQKGPYSALQDWDNGNNYYLRFTLKNEDSNEELYWICRNDVLGKNEMFLVPYFEKMQKMYNGQNVVSTINKGNLADVNTGEAVNIQPSEVWQCSNVTFVHSKDNILVQPYFFIEKDGKKVMIKFADFTKNQWGILSEEDKIRRPTFMLEQEYNEIIAERKSNAEEKQRIEEERLRLEEQARAERNKQIMKKYGNRYGKMICNGEVCLNMTKEMCIEAWGEPCYINSTIVKGLVHEQWVYWGSYLYFDNGVLTGIQN